jgi:membrane protease subunit HflK
LPELQRKMNSYESGVKIIEVKTQNAELLPAVDEAYKQVEKANQYKNGKLEEAQKYRNTVIPQAEAEAIKLIEGAKGYKAEVVSRGKAGVAEFEALYTEYQKNPEIVKEKYYVESMKEFITNNNIIVDTTKSGQIHKFFNMDDGQKPIKLDAVQ